MCKIPRIQRQLRRFEERRLKAERVAQKVLGKRKGGMRFTNSGALELEITFALFRCH